MGVVVTASVPVLPVSYRLDEAVAQPDDGGKSARPAVVEPFVHSHTTGGQEQFLGFRPDRPGFDLR